jgi:hypothetical protein
LLKKGSGPLQKGDNHNNAKMGLKTIEPEELKFRWELSDIM